jgi:hypothetical protein
MTTKTFKINNTPDFNSVSELIVVDGDGQMVMDGACFRNLSHLMNEAQDWSNEMGRESYIGRRDGVGGTFDILVEV